MNIVLFSPSWPQHSDANGIVTYCANMKVALERSGHRVFIISNYMDNKAEVDTYKVSYQPSFGENLIGRIGERFFTGFEQYYYGAKGIVATLKKIEAVCHIDVFEIEESFGWHYYIAKKVKFPVVMRLHGPHFLGCQVFGKVMDSYDVNRCRREDRAFKQVDYVNAPSRWVMESVQERLPLQWKLARVFGNPIDPVPADARWKSRQCDLHKVLFVGRFDLLKGGDIIINAFAKVLKAIPDAQLIFAGPDRGLLQTDGTFVHFEDLVTESIPSQYRKQIQCLGQVTKDVIGQLRQQCHISVTASRSEVFGYTVVESMATGVPVVAPRVAGVAELFEDGVSGLYFEPENAEDMAEKITNLMNELPKSEFIGDQAYTHCTDEFSLERIAEKALAYYGEVVDDYNQC